MALDTNMLDLVDRLYASALGELEGTMRRAARLFGGVAAAVEVHGSNGALLAFDGWRLPEDGMRGYAEYYRLVCPRLRGWKR